MSLRVLLDLSRRLVRNFERLLSAMFFYFYFYFYFYFTYLTLMSCDDQVYAFGLLQVLAPGGTAHADSKTFRDRHRLLLRR